MKASELIKELQEIIEKEGDLEVTYPANMMDDAEPFSPVDFLQVLKNKEGELVIRVDI